MLQLGQVPAVRILVRGKHTDHSEQMGSAWLRKCVCVCVHDDGDECRLTEAQMESVYVIWLEKVPASSLCFTYMLRHCPLHRSVRSPMLPLTSSCAGLPRMACGRTKGGAGG